jgi:hypothetical protein
MSERGLSETAITGECPLGPRMHRLLPAFGAGPPGRCLDGCDDVPAGSHSLEVLRLLDRCADALPVLGTS